MIYISLMKKRKTLTKKELIDIIGKNALDKTVRNSVCGDCVNATIINYEENIELDNFGDAILTGVCKKCRKEVTCIAEIKDVVIDTKRKSILDVEDQKALWGECGPYSQANLVLQDRVLDNFINRRFAYVELEINPYTFRLVKKHKKEFKHNSLVDHIIKRAQYRGDERGYIAGVVIKEIISEEDMVEVTMAMEVAQKTLIEMHEFVMDKLGISKDRRTDDDGSIPSPFM